MAYLKLNNIDFSNYVSDLKVSSTANYSAQTNAAGDTVVDYINQKTQIEATFIPMLVNSTTQSLLTQLSGFNVEVKFLNPITNSLTTRNCICDKGDIEYYTIQSNRIMLKSFKATFKQL